MAGKIDRLERGTSKLIERIDGLIEEYNDALGIESLDVWDNAIYRGKIEAYNNCKILIEKYLS